MTWLFAELVAVLLVLPFAAIGLGHLFGRLEVWVTNVRARRSSLARQRTRSGVEPARRGHTCRSTPEHFRGGHWQ